MTGTVRQFARSISSARAWWLWVTSTVSKGIAWRLSSSSARRHQPHVFVLNTFTGAPETLASSVSCSGTKDRCRSAVFGFAVVGEVLEDHLIQALVVAQLCRESVLAGGRFIAARRIPGHLHPEGASSRGRRHVRDDRLLAAGARRRPGRLPWHADVTRRRQRLRCRIGGGRRAGAGGFGGNDSAVAGGDRSLRAGAVRCGA